MLYKHKYALMIKHKSISSSFGTGRVFIFYFLKEMPVPAVTPVGHARGTYCLPLGQVGGCIR